MELQKTELDGGILLVTLTGSLDIAGAGVLDLPFSVISGSRDKVIVDLTAVDFLASIGVRTIIKTAKPIAQRGGRMVLVNPNEAVQKVLVSTGVDTLVPIVPDRDAAVALFA